MCNFVPFLFLFLFLFSGNIKQTNNEQPTTSGNTKQTHHPPSKITHHQGKFGMGHPPPVAKSLFSFASMRPGSKNHPFKYAAKLVGYRLGKKERRKFVYVEIHYENKKDCRLDNTTTRFVKNGSL